MNRQEAIDASSKALDEKQKEDGADASDMAIAAAIIFLIGDLIKQTARIADAIETHVNRKA